MRFCLVTQHHLCNNPRLVKEADTLTEAGHDVRVVWLDARADLRARDAALTAKRRWRLSPVSASREGMRGWIGWEWDGVRREAARRIDDLGISTGWLAEQALERWPSALERAVRRHDADVIVAHTLGALPPAARAARALGARLVFDAEDLHVGELPDDPTHARARARVASVEREFLPGCDRLVASSDGIADALVRMYGVQRPRVVLNAFPLPALPVIEERALEAAVRLYWFSQVIGLDRGIQTVLEAMAIVGGGIDLYLRGEDRPELTRELRARADEVGLGDRMHLLPIVPPDELPFLSAAYDVGLALETGQTENRALCVTNKLMTYLAAGLAVAATDTPAQRAVMQSAPGAGFLFPAGDSRALAAGLCELIEQPGKLAAARRASRRAAEAKFSWGHERRRLLDALTDWSTPSSSVPDGAAHTNRRRAP